MKEFVDRAGPRQPRRGDARAIIPEWPLLDGRRVLRGARADLVAREAASGARSPDRHRRRIAVAVASSRVLLDVHWLSK